MKRILLAFLMLFAAACDRTKGLAKEAANFLESRGDDPPFSFFDSNDLYMMEFMKMESDEKALQVIWLRTDTDLSEYGTKGEDEKESMLTAILSGECEGTDKCPEIQGGRSVIDFGVDGKVDIYLYLEEGKKTLFGINFRAGVKLEGEKRSKPSSGELKMAQNDYRAMLERAAKEIRGMTKK